MQNKNIFQFFFYIHWLKNISTKSSLLRNVRTLAWRFPDIVKERTSLHYSWLVMSVVIQSVEQSSLQYKYSTYNFLSPLRYSFIVSCFRGNPFKLFFTCRPSIVCEPLKTESTHLGSRKVTNPNPLDLPVCLSMITTASDTSPYWLK